MKLHSLFRQISSHFSPKPPWVNHFHTSATTQERTVHNEVLTILDTINPMEPALEPLLPFLDSRVVTCIIQNQPNPQLGFRFFIWSIQKTRLRSKKSNQLIIDMLYKDNLFDLYLQTLEQVKNSGGLIGSDAFLVLINAYSKLGLPKEAVEAFGKMNDFDCKPDVLAYNAILRVMMRKEVFILALAVYNQMLKANCLPNCSTFCILIDGLCKVGKTKYALELFDEMTSRGILPNRITYTIIASGLCQAKRADDALRLFNKMRAVGCSPDCIAYNALINGFCLLGRLDEAFALLRNFRKDGFVLRVQEYSCMINALFRARRYDEVFAWYRRMFEENVKPDVILYTIMIRGSAEAGMVKEAMDLLNEMAEKGVAPDTYCYNAVIKGFCDMGLLDNARSLQLEISKNNCFPNACTYTILICGMCRNGLVGEAQQIFSEMEKLGCFPSVVTFNALIDGLCKAGEREKAHLLFYKMEVGRNPSLFLRLSQGANRVLDSESLQYMVGQLCESGLILKAYSILVQLADNGILPDIWTYNILINGFCKAGNINGAVKLFKELQFKGLSPDCVTYGTLINGFYMVDREEDAVNVFEHMLKSGCIPNSSVYKTLMTWSCRKKKVSVSFSLWLRYLKSLPDRQGEAIKVIEEHFGKGHVEVAVQGLLEMDFKLKDFDLAPYTIWLIGLCQIGSVEEALHIFSILEKCKVTVTPPSCLMLIKGLCTERNLDLAMDVFHYTLEKGFILSPRICNNLLVSLLQTQDKKEHAFDLLIRMKSLGYDLNACLYATTRTLLHRHWNMRRKWKM